MIEYSVYKPLEFDVESIFHFIKEMDTRFTPPMSSRVDLYEWATKLSNLAHAIVAMEEGKIIGMEFFYFNQKPLQSYGAYVCVREGYEDELVGVNLMKMGIDYCKVNGSAGFYCCVRESNAPLCNFYKKLGFAIDSIDTYPNTEIKKWNVSKKF